MKQRIEVPSSYELAWVTIQCENAVGFVGAFSPQDAGRPLTLAALDKAFAAWVSTSQNDETGVINQRINSIGAAFGRFLVEGAGFNWVIATDEHGSDLAVHALPGRGDVLVYPTNFVAKRWESRETYFLERSYQQIVEQVQAILRAG